MTNDQNPRQLTPFDAADYLKSDADVAGYLAAAFETGDASDVVHALATVVRARGVSDTARQADLARGTLTKAITPGANPTLSTLIAILQSMNMTLSAQPRASG